MITFCYKEIAPTTASTPHRNVTKMLALSIWFDDDPPTWRRTVPLLPRVPVYVTVEKDVAVLVLGVV